MDNLHELTEQIIIDLDALKQIFQQGNVPVKDKVFFQFVKKETDPIFDKLDHWEKMALDEVKQQKVSLHPQQIQATKDNMTALLLHSFYIDVRKRRYMEIYKSCHYIFSLLLKETNNEG